MGESRESSVQRDRVGGLRAGLPQTARIETIWLEEAPETDFPALARDGITAFAATSDLHALRILTALQRAGLAIPREASVAGFDDRYQKPISGGYSDCQLLVLAKPQFDECTALIPAPRCCCARLGETARACFLGAGGKARKLSMRSCPFFISTFRKPTL